MKIYSLFFTLLFSLFFHNTQAQEKTLNTDKHQELITLFDDWRSFEAPPLLEGLPDYSQATFDKRWPAFVALKKRLQEISKNLLGNLKI